MAQLYSEEFFAGQQAGSATSADVVVPLVLSLIPSRSVVDVGCGVGGWLAAFARCGVDDYLGVDGDYVARQLLRIPAERFLPRDLTRLTDLGRRFDLACSLEVAEHLPSSCAEQFVALLAKAAPAVLFSAAVPGQGGTNHLNERWQSYWADLFARHGYVAVDCIRPAIFHDERVEWWYRQNILVFCEPERCPPAHQPVTRPYDLDRIHPSLLATALAGPQSGRAALRALAGTVKVIGRAALYRTLRRANGLGRWRKAPPEQTSPCD
ncbi:methyltransferase domain-containing protein [Chelatococcus sp. SYSU_G07232]|uniref:Methyltransferase domain-containing protein n=1 Tax=Chelatococcus albus TaxID=3047466 RepID=A0ABT7AE84_9HYPH|nr:methyltransferase domain-containing protein [Chelatococcus sp. SYSU_G07232]MDJ1157686.1 methyltransferase domain-containing protein [Chelatococcus sp. SYSU_G07232]